MDLGMTWQLYRHPRERGDLGMTWQLYRHPRERGDPGKIIEFLPLKKRV